MRQEGHRVSDFEALEGLVVRTVELIVLAFSLAERMQRGPRTPTLDEHLRTLEDTVRRGQRYLQHLAQDEVDYDAARGSRPIRER